MSVAQLAEHVSQHLEELVIVEPSGHLRGVAFVNGLPADAFLGEKTVVLVHDTPQSLEVAIWRVGELVFVNAACKEEKRKEEKPYPNPPEGK